MKKIERILWIGLIIIVILILSVICIVIVRNNNKNNINNNDNKDIYSILLDKKNWFCYDAVYYAEDGTKKKFDHYDLQFIFYDEYVDKCLKGVCEKVTYNIKGDIFIVDNNDLFEEKYTLKYEKEILILEENREIGTKIVYYLSNPVG